VHCERRRLPCARLPADPKAGPPPARARAHLAHGRVHDRGAVHFELDAPPPHLPHRARDVGGERADLEARGVGCWPSGFWGPGGGRPGALNLPQARWAAAQGSKPGPRPGPSKPPRPRAGHTLGLGISPLGPRILPTLTSARIMSGWATARSKSIDLPRDSSSASTSSSPGWGGRRRRGGVRGRRRGAAPARPGPATTSARACRPRRGRRSPPTTSAPAARASSAAAPSANTAMRTGRPEEKGSTAAPRTIWSPRRGSTLSRTCASTVSSNRALAPAWAWGRAERRGGVARGRQAAGGGRRARITAFSTAWQRLCRPTPLPPHLDLRQRLHQGQRLRLGRAWQQTRQHALAAGVEPGAAAAARAGRAAVGRRRRRGAAAAAAAGGRVRRRRLGCRGRALRGGV
jgi:hypothetical protein